MPPRFAYWTIIAGGLPTAFRATHRDELMPTFQRLRDKHPDAVMKWFARGKLWDSPEDARAEYEKRRQQPDRRRERRGRTGEPGSAPKETRGRDWRPGGDHRDPRQKYADAKKARNAARRKMRFERKQSWPARRDDDRPSQNRASARFDTSPSSPKRHRDERPPRHGRDRERPGGPPATWEKRPPTGSKPRPKSEAERRSFERPSFARSQHQEKKPAAAGRSPHQAREASADTPRGKRPGEPEHPKPPSRHPERGRRFRR